ncbi:hypothetical protein [Paracoccus sp. SM22M-07]|uniref:hypothetical protein n=1 Tax=Paracoccus sp. SM22M-07 TaxID=1520813 RepID=UPI00091EBB6C|nr:hypothetical protein [Paracoccus sp. SM22M-07]OJH46178.1 hypothetical protein IE00_02930 [Paracoccus sp. SM22M-07]
MPITIEWRIADQDGAPGPINTIIGPDGDGVVTLLPSDTDVQVRAAGESQWTDLRTLPAPVDPDAVPVMRQTFGGRPNVIPMRFYEDGQNELIDPATHPHIMGFTHTAIRDGFWSDPTLWDAGTVPGPGAVVSIGSNTVFYDHFSDDILKDLLVPMGGRFELATWAETRLRLDYWMTMGVVNLTDTKESSTAGAPKHEIIFHASEAPGATTRLGAMFMGPTRIRGTEKRGHLRLADLQVAAGATELPLTGLAASGWRIGDTLHILGTEYVPLVSTDPQWTGPDQYYASGNGQQSLNEFQFGQDEERTIVAINGDVVTLDAPLTYTHAGTSGVLKDGQVLTIRPVVANVCRSIRFRTASAEEDGTLDPNADLTDLQKRAHMMFHRCPDVDVRYFEAKNMARTSTDPTLFVGGLPYKCARAGGEVTIQPITDVAGGTPLANPLNVRGRYAVHFHWCGGPYATSPLIHCIGLSCWAPIGEVPQPGWALTQHGTRMTIEDCVVSNVRGAGMVSELGNETGQWLDNVVTGARSDGDGDGWGSRQEYYSNQNGSQGAAYENQSRAILMHGNIAGSSRYAYIWHAQKDNSQKRSQRDIDLRMVDGMHHGVNFNLELNRDEVIGNINVQIPPMLDCEAHACRRGFAVIHRQGDGRHYDKTPLLVERFLTLNVPFSFDVPEYSNSYDMKDCLIQAPDPIMSGSFGFAFGNVTWDWNVSNSLVRNCDTAFRNSGAGINYEGHFIDIITENCTRFSNTDETAFSTIANITAQPWWNVMGDAFAHPTDPNKGVPRVWKNEDSVNLPLPYPLEPYGRKLPAGYPAVNPGDTPYFVLGDGTNGAATTTPVAIDLTLTAGTGRSRGRFHGIIRDSVGDRRYPDWQSSESFPNNLTIKSHRTFGKLQPEQVVRRWGCWNDNGVWKTRTWFMGADRFTHVRFSFHADWTLVGFPEEFLLQHELDGPSESPEWPDKPERANAKPLPFGPVEEPIRFLSRTTLEAVDGQPLTHSLRPNRVASSMSIVGGADAAQFRVSMQQLQWVGGGTRSLSPATDADADNVFEVVVRVMDAWGQTHDQAHQVKLISSDRVSPAILENFTRANEPMTANPNYVVTAGVGSVFQIVSNKLSVLTNGVAGGPSVLDMGSLGTSDQEVHASLRGGNGPMIALRMEDPNNFIGFRRGLYESFNEMLMIKDGVLTKVCEFENWGHTWFKIRLVDNRVDFIKTVGAGEEMSAYPKADKMLALRSLENDPHSAPSTFLLPDNAPKGTNVGVYASHGADASGWGIGMNFRAL